MADPVLLVFTVEGEDLILRRGWSGYWKVSAWRAREIKYVLFCQNTNNTGDKKDWEFATATKPHGAGFMLARLAEVVPSQDVEGRWNLKLDGFVRVDLPNLWKGWRFPINYEHTLQDLGLDPDTLSFEPMPPPEEVEAAEAMQVVEETRPVSRSDSALADIEKYAAERLGVQPDEVEISITLLPRRRAA